MWSFQRAERGTGQLVTRNWRVLTRAWRSACARHPALRLAQIIPIGFLLWGLDDAASLRAGAPAAGLRHAATVNSVSLDVGGKFPLVMNNWLAADHLGALAATWYYIVMQGALTGVIGAFLIWRRPPTLRLHRNALIAITAAGLVAFWCYPVAPPRLLPGYHDIVAATLPAFSSAVEPNGSAVYASLPSLHVAWGLWAAIAGAALVRRPILRALLWLYPAATIIDILATANHYVLDVLTAPGLVILGYGLAIAVERARGRLASRRSAAVRWGYATWSPGVIRWPFGWSSALVIRAPYGWSSPRVSRCPTGWSPPRVSRGPTGWSPALAIRAPSGWSGRRLIRAPSGWSSPRAVSRWYGGSLPRASQPPGAVPASALPGSGGCDGRDSDTTQPR
jgi:PAP2 superfamily